MPRQAPTWSMGWEGCLRLGRGHLPTIQAEGGHSAAVGGTCEGIRTPNGYLGGFCTVLAGFPRPNHARKPFPAVLPKGFEQVLRTCSYPCNLGCIK